MKRINFKIVKLIIFCTSFIIFFISLTVLFVAVIFNEQNYGLYIKADHFVPKLVLSEAPDNVHLKENLNKFDKVQVVGLLPRYVTLEVYDNQKTNEMVSDFYGSYKIKDKTLTIDRSQLIGQLNHLDIKLYIKYDMADVVNSNKYSMMGKIDDNGTIKIDLPLMEGRYQMNLDDCISAIKQGDVNVFVPDLNVGDFLAYNEMTLETWDEYGQRNYYDLCNDMECLSLLINDKTISISDYGMYYYPNYDDPVEYLLFVNDNKGYDYEINEDKLTLINTANDEAWDIDIREEKDE